VAYAQFQTMVFHQGTQRCHGLAHVFGEGRVFPRVYAHDPACALARQRGCRFQMRQEGARRIGFVAHEVDAHNGATAQAGLHAAQHIQIPLQIVMPRQCHQKADADTQRCLNRWQHGVRLGQQRGLQDAGK
jgi:hypothetical protein